jgi:molybdopterin molybdotransferase
VKRVDVNAVPTSLQDIAARIDGYDASALPMAQAREFLERLVPRVQEAQRVSLLDALGRVMARDVVSHINVPLLDNSAMDGYALRGAELHRDAPTSLMVCGTAFAGQPFEGEVAAGQCLRIMTGAVMPAGCDTVVPQEFVHVADGLVTVPACVVRIGDNRRLAGEDLARGEVALKAGRIITPADLGLMASLGQAEVEVFRPLRVAFFSTGNELRSVGEALDAGCVYDSNRYTLWAMLKRQGMQVLDLGVIPDEPVALAKAFRHAAENADAIITSGGVSVGEADHTKQVMAQLGDVLFWTVGMRPGRPMAIGRIHHAAGNGSRSAILFGLPGNPVAVMVTFYALVRDALLAMSGAAAQPLPMMRVVAAQAIRKKPGRTEYQRGIVSIGADGHQTVRITGAQGSGILRSMSEANGLIVLHHGQGAVAAGDLVDVMPFHGLM